MNIKAFLLSAGIGSRLRPITNSIPKCLVPLGDTPILGIWFKKLEQISCKSVLVNTHYLSSQVVDYIQNVRSNYSFDITTSFEKSLLGTAGSLMANLDFLDDSLCILIHADNYMYDSLYPAIRQHCINQPLLTMITFNTLSPQSCGIVTVNDENIVQSFHEKVLSPPGNLANGAIYIFDSRFLDYLRNLDCLQSDLFDFSTQILPGLVGQIQIWHTFEMFTDIGNLESYQLANHYFVNHGIK